MVLVVFAGNVSDFKEPDLNCRLAKLFIFTALGRLSSRMKTLQDFLFVGFCNRKNLAVGHIHFNFVTLFAFSDFLYLADTDHE